MSESFGHNTSNLAPFAPNHLQLGSVCPKLAQDTCFSNLCFFASVNFSILHILPSFFLQMFTFSSALFLVSQTLTFCAVVIGAHRPRITNNRNNEPGNNETCEQRCGCSGEKRHLVTKAPNGRKNISKCLTGFQNSCLTFNCQC